MCREWHRQRKAGGASVIHEIFVYSGVAHTFASSSDVTGTYKALGDRHAKACFARHVSGDVLFGTSTRGKPRKRMIYCFTFTCTVDDKASIGVLMGRSPLAFDKNDRARCNIVARCSFILLYHFTKHFDVCTGLSTHYSQLSRKGLLRRIFQGFHFVIHLLHGSTRRLVHGVTNHPTRFSLIRRITLLQNFDIRVIILNRLRHSLQRRGYVFVHVRRWGGSRRLWYV